MLEKDQFLKEYNIDVVDFEKTTIDWACLTDIFDDYSKYRLELEEPAIYLFNTLMKSPNVHSVRYRIKNAEHLIEKIIRKKIEDSSSNITTENYKEAVTDLIGLRALHLYKDDWEKLHDYISEKWNLLHKPIANYRKGDTQELIRIFEEKGCEVKEHKFGYRSVHYIIESQPAKIKFLAEIQVRTIFEEAWSEIDHTIRYPYDLDNVLFSQFLLILNRLAGSADEMGSYIKLLKQELTQRDFTYQKQIDEKSKLILNLESKVANLNLQEKEFNGLQTEIDKLKNQTIWDPSIGSKVVFNSINDFSNLYQPKSELTKYISDLRGIGNTSKFFELSKSLTKTQEKMGIVRPKKKE